METEKEKLCDEIQVINKMLSNDGKSHVDNRELQAELQFGPAKVCALMHGKNKSVESYRHFYLYLLEFRGIKVEESKILEMVIEAITKNEEIAITLVDKRTHKQVGKSEIVVLHVD